MTITLDEICFGKDLEGVMAAPDASRWNLERVGPLEIYVSMSPARAPKEIFQAKLQWSAYPTAWPSLKFCHPGTGNFNDPSAWPVCPGYRPSSLDSCVHWTEEGHRLHPEWANSPAHRCDTSGNQLWRCLCFLQDSLDLTFCGRYGT